MISDLLSLAICSDLRRNILITLNEGKKTLADLRAILNISSTTAIHALRELEKSNLTFQNKDKSYALTNIGSVVALKLLNFNDTCGVMRKHERFWLEHDMSGIPAHLMDKIGSLKGSSLVQINPLDIIKTHSSFVDIIKTAKWIKGVSPIYSPDYTTLFKELVERNISTHLILNEAVFNKSTDAVGLEKLKNALSNYSLKISIIDEKLKIAFTVTDSYLSIGLFTNDGIYDTAYDLIASDNRAVSWGCELFEYYSGKAKNIDKMFSDFK